ncbi:P-loop containing nucleoside triphosphate hydrolase protein [Ceraceosorus guamensis]|uniref:Adenylate kinase isoenzyme 6 homolog n=1 Tax=Ceraceosorus guamensis TaxID=1522189 RepID=A0A316WC53_9BASI|nr:P-loop containing nucleoside triphosphate hydrolase protein [Ceraceosorus guamensis]PWN46221.1 P-loop containing nucleoside triphosphate hydrolase protein [Ceraceosorus guamensis]
MPRRAWPNIVLTGTPGVGKSTHATQLHARLPALEQIDVTSLCKSNHFTLNYDEAWDTFEVDEDKLLDFLEEKCGFEPVEVEDGGSVQEDEDEKEKEKERKGGTILDWHTCDAYPERWVDLVVVLTCDHAILWERLEKRNYPLAKIQENNSAEIMQVVLSEAHEAYDEQIVVALKSENAEQVEENVERIVAWVDAWRRQRGLSGV